MIERREYFRLALKSRQPFEIGREGLGQDFECYVPLQSRIACAIHLSHSAFARDSVISYGPTQAPTLNDMAMIGNPSRANIAT